MQTSPGNISDGESSGYSIVRLNSYNLADVAKLHATVYGKAVAAEYFPKKYDTAYTGVQYVGYIAYSAQRIPVAYYGVIPCFIQYGNTRTLAAQSADTMTDPNHRFKGMFVELSKICFELCRKLGILLIFGFPNQNSYHGAVNKLGWKMTASMKCFTIPVKSLPLESLSGRSGFLKKLYKQYCRSVLYKRTVSLKGVANSVLEDDLAGMCRSDAYLNYKTYSPTQVIAIGDARIWISIKYGLVIGDLSGVNEMNFSEVINRLKKTVRSLGMRQLQFHCSAGTKLYELFAQVSEATESYPMLFQDFGSAIPPEMIGFTFADIDIF